MTSLSLGKLIETQTLQLLLEQAWGFSGVPCRVILPPTPGDAAQVTAQAPRQNASFHLPAAILWEPNSPLLEGEILFLENRRSFFFPLRVKNECAGILEAGSYIMAADGSVASGIERAPRLSPEQRERVIESYTNLGRAITRMLEQALAAQESTRGLTELQRRYRGVFDGVQDGILFESIDGHILDANLAAAAMHGYTREEMLDLRVIDLIPPTRAYLNLSGSSPRGDSIETTDIRKDGSIFPVQLTAQTLEIDGYTYQMVVVRDLSAAHQAEETARHSQERLELALEATEAGFWDWEILNGYSYYSPRWFTMLGYLPDELPPTVDTWRRLIHPQDSLRTQMIMDQYLAGKRPFYEVEYRLRAKDGGWRWVLSRGKIIRRDESGKPLRMTGTHIDISLRKQSETALRSSEEKFYKSFQISPDAISISRAADAIYMDVNTVFLTISGYTREEVIGKNSTEIGIWAFPEERAEFVRQLQEKGEVLGLEASFRHRDGSLGIGLVAARPIEIDGIPCVLTIVRDITDRKRADDMLRDAHIRLQWAYEATLLGWNKALEMGDVATRRHSDRCTDLTLRLARAAGISADEELTFIKYGAILHDIGKLAIPDIILNKPTPFSAEEWNIMRRHPLYAQEMLQGIDYLHPVLALVASHHERWDGSGYPLGLEGGQIPLEARIFALVDVWDSMTTARPYRPAMSETAARQYILDNIGRHFDPELVPLFLELIAPKG